MSNLLPSMFNMNNEASNYPENVRRDLSLVLDNFDTGNFVNYSQPEYNQLSGQRRAEKS